MLLSVEQCRAARALLGWSTNALADAAKLGLATVRRFETGNPVQLSSIEAMQKALESAGITLIAAGKSSLHGGEGVRFRPPPQG
jgi:transcriptional regulator with XRE-family HTH domain